MKKQMRINKHELRNMKHELRNVKLETRNSKNEKPDTNYKTGTYILLLPVKSNTGNGNIF